ncbi:MAG: excinuclease ABC subunit UvrB [Planctomycetota bacterium]|nr:excinuclease ABC subunit UvrB [Planctomycetota bacterium]
MAEFKLVSPYEPSGDQPGAITQLTGSLESGNRYSTLLGVTGSGKTFTMANVIRNFCRPTLVLSHNKTLAAQLYAELKTFFPENSVHYFVSYYDYYQPEAYVPSTDTYIEKDASINESVERLRLASTAALVSREDVIIVASVSAIYGLGSPREYEGMTVKLRVGETYPRKKFLRSLVDIQYTRNDWDFSRGRIRVRGDVIEIYPAYAETALRLEFFDEDLESIVVIDPTTGSEIERNEMAVIFPATHFVLPKDSRERAFAEIEREMRQRVKEFREQGKLIEAQRIQERTLFDLEMLQETGICPGIENYSRILANRTPGSRPYVLLDYFPKGFLTIVDESHVTLPQVKGMFYGDRSRKQTLVDHGFRLPSALDNRPLRFEEFLEVTDQVVFVSATPAEFEKQHSSEVVEQIIRPTGLVDPPIEVRPATGQIDDLLRECRTAAENGERVLITTITKRLAEDVSVFMQKQNVRCRYLHSEIDTLERVEILHELRKGSFDVLVGVNLLREGLDLPEVALVAILDSDKAGFLRNESSLIQTMGRCARNLAGQVILYADTITPAMRNAIDETERRREIQLRYNEEHGIEPVSVRREVRDVIREALAEVGFASNETDEEPSVVARADNLSDAEQLHLLTEEMHRASAEMRFEDAAAIRDKLAEVTGDNRFSPPTSLKPRSTKRKRAKRGKGKRRVK